MCWDFSQSKTCPRGELCAFYHARKLQRKPLPGPSYCGEKLAFTEKNWAPSKAQANAFGWMSKQFYDHLYTCIRNGAKLEVTPQQVKVQMAVMEECHRQAKLSKLPAKGWPQGNR